MTCDLRFVPAGGAGNLSHVEKKTVLTCLDSFSFALCWLGNSDSTRSLVAVSFPHYLTGSWNFAHNRPSSGEHLFFPALKLNTQKTFY